MVYLWVALAGALGSLARFAISVWLPRGYGGFPWATMTVNLVGCFLFGLVWALAEEKRVFSPEQRLWLTAGFLGGFTTFSSFGFETVELVRAGFPGKAGLHVLSQNLLGPVAVLLGHKALS